MVSLGSYRNTKFSHNREHFPPRSWVAGHSKSPSVMRAAHRPREPYQEPEPTTRLLHNADPGTGSHTPNNHRQRNPVKVSLCSTGGGGRRSRPLPWQGSPGSRARRPLARPRTLSSLTVRHFEVHTCDPELEGFILISMTPY